MAPVPRRVLRAQGEDQHPSASSPTNGKQRAERRSFQVAPEEDEDDWLLTAGVAQWIDDFATLRACRWAFDACLELYQAALDFASPSSPSSGSSSSSRNGTSKKKEGEEVLLKDAALQFVSTNKVPLGFLTSFVLVCAICIGGEKSGVDRRLEVPGDAVEATSKLVSNLSVQLTRDNFDELVTFSNDVWIVQVFRHDSSPCADFHPFWENKTQEHSHLIRFGRIDIAVAHDLNKWLPVRIRVLPTVLKFSRHLGMVDIFPITESNQTSQALTEFVLNSFPIIDLPVDDNSSLVKWSSGVSRHHKVLLVRPDGEDYYKSQQVAQKLAARWSEIFDLRIIDSATLHLLLLPTEVQSALPHENVSGQQAAVFLFPASGSSTPVAASRIDWPPGEEELALELLDFAERTGPSLSVPSADLFCRPLPTLRVYCLVLLDATETMMSQALREVRESQEQYMKEVKEIRAGGGEVLENEDKFVVPVLRLLRTPVGMEPSVESCHAPEFHRMEKTLGGASAFLMDLEKGRVAALKDAPSFHGLYAQIAYEDSLAWTNKVLDSTKSLPDCSEDLWKRFTRQLRHASLWDMVLLFMFAILLVELIARAMDSDSMSWWLGILAVLVPPLLMSPPFQRWCVAQLPGWCFPAKLLDGLHL